MNFLFLHLKDSFEFLQKLHRETFLSQIIMAFYHQIYDFIARKMWVRWAWRYNWVFLLNWVTEKFKLSIFILGFFYGHFLLFFIDKFVLIYHFFLLFFRYSRLIVSKIWNVLNAFLFFKFLPLSFHRRIVCLFTFLRFSLFCITFTNVLFQFK